MHYTAIAAGIGIVAILGGAYWYYTRNKAKVDSTVQNIKSKL